MNDAAMSLAAEVARVGRAMLPEASVAALPVRDTPPPLLGNENDAAGRMAPRRLRVFAAGRACAREAMRSLGHPALPVPVRPDRTPAWPPGVCGSIAHTDTCAIAAVAPVEVIRSLGIDLESGAPLDDNLLGRVLVEVELARIRRHDRPHRMAKTLFCAKEAVYKCTWPITGVFLDFHDVCIGPAGDDGRLLVSGRNDRLPAALADAIELRVVEVGDLVLATASIRADDEGRMPVRSGRRPAAG